MVERSEKEKMLAGELYHASDPELVADSERCELLLAEYNATTSGDAELRESLLQKLLGAVGPGAVIKPTFRCDYGYNIRLGRNAFINFNCVLLDCAPIEIGDNVQMAPCVQLYTATHPLDPAVRRSGLESALPIRIGSDVWLGGGAIVLPGVTIGDACVIGAGSVVTRDLPKRSLAVGNPARVVRAIDTRI